jgi:predicted DNA-binding helix-hairpin-helix protein
MDMMLSAVRVLRRKHGFDGYVHLKIIPGASDAAVEEALSAASTVSVNVEAPTRSAFRRLSAAKDYDRDIVRTVKLISHLTGRGMRHSRVRQVTQFVVGAADETDGQLVQAMGGLYDRLGLSRIYFSAYQRGLGDPDLPGERGGPRHARDLLAREHRLYQADWLMRKYGFGADEIPMERDGNLSLDADPKELWARRHPERFPVDVNRADKWQLLRVPGFGPTTVERILAIRSEGRNVRRIEEVGRPCKRLAKAAQYVEFGARPGRPAPERRRA